MVGRGLIRRDVEKLFGQGAKLELKMTVEPWMLY